MTNCWKSCEKYCQNSILEKVTEVRGAAMKIQILQMIEGARKARGLTVVIDVFRAFSLECYLMEKDGLLLSREIYLPD